MVIHACVPWRFFVCFCAFVANLFSCEGALSVMFFSLGVTFVYMYLALFSSLGVILRLSFVFSTPKNTLLPPEQLYVCPIYIV